MNQGLIKLLKNQTGDDVVPASLAIVPKPAKTPQEVWQAVTAFGAVQGWLCLTDEVLAIAQPADLENAKGRIILSAELVKGGLSLHIRQAQEGWNLLYLTAGQGDDCLKLTESFISTETSQNLRLCYDVYWKSDKGAFAPHGYRFTGFAKGEEQA